MFLLRIIIIINLIKKELRRSFLRLFVFVVRVWLKLIGRVFGIGLMAFLHILSLKAEILGAQRIERRLWSLKSIANINRPELFVGGYCSPTWPVRISKRDDSIAGGCSLLFADVVKQLSAAVHSGTPAPFESKLLKAYMEFHLPLSSLIAFNL